MNDCPESRLLNLIKENKSDSKKANAEDKRGNYPVKILFFVLILILIILVFVVNQNEKPNIIDEPFTIPDTQKSEIHEVPPPVNYSVIGVINNEDPSLIIKDNQSDKLNTIKVGEYLDDYKLKEIKGKKAAFTSKNQKFYLRLK